MTSAKQPPEFVNGKTFIADTREIRFTTERLVLRCFTKNDFDALHDLRRKEEVVRYLYGDVHTPEQSKETLDNRLTMTSLDKDGDKLILAVEEKDTGKFVGDIVLILTDKDSRQGEIGFVFNPEFHGRGYGYEASKELLHFGFDRLGLHRIVGRCDPRNGASAGLLKKLGLQQEAHLVENVWAKGEWTDELIFAMRSAQWLESAHNPKNFPGQRTPRAKELPINDIDLSSN